MTEKNFIILDLEWNQSCDPEAADKKLQFEIIEIGAVHMDENRRMTGEFSQLIKPQIYHELNKITSRLIHMKMSQLRQGRPFPEVMEEFRAWCGENPIFCTWGPQDLSELQNNMQYYGMEPLTDKPLPFLDVQKLFSLAFEDGRSRKALEYAVDFLQIEKDIPFHRAFSDAYYTGKVFAKIPEKICRRVSFDLFHPPAKREDEVRIVFDTYAKYISRVFDSKSEALADWEVISSKCYLCRRNLKKKIRWFTVNGRHYYCAAYCEKHGYLKGKIRIRKTQDDKVFVVKTMRFITEEEMETLREKRAKLKKGG